MTIRSQTRKIVELVYLEYVVGKDSKPDDKISYILVTN